jgi:hypothetical protein
VVEVRVYRDEHGRVFSRHQLQDDADHGVAMSWPGGGQGSIAFGLLLEAIRREAILEMLLQMTHDPEAVERLQDLPEDKRDEAFEQMAKVLRMQMNKTIAKVARGAVEEAYLATRD